LIIIENKKDAMDMIRHDNKRIDLYIWEMGGYFLSTLPGDQPQGIFLHRIVHHLAKYIFPPEGDDCDIKTSGLRIIVIPQPDGFSLMGFGFWFYHDRPFIYHPAIPPSPDLSQFYTPDLPSKRSHFSATPLH
jgi:hypothetical protein